MIRAGALLGAALLLGAAALGAGAPASRPVVGAVGDLASDLRRLRPRWAREDVRAAVRQWGPRWLPGVPALALLASGVTAVSSSERGGPPDFATGLWGVELRRAEGWAGDATTRADLGRSVDTSAEAFSRDIAGQAYLGFRSYSDHLNTVLAGLPESVRGTPGSVWRWRLAVSAYSSGPGPVIGLVRAVAAELAAVPEGQRWAVLGERVVAAARRGERTLGGVALAGRWRAAYLLLRCERRARVGRALAAELAPGEVSWFGEALGSDLVAELERVAAGERLDEAPAVVPPPAGEGDEGEVREGLRWVAGPAETLGCVLGGTAAAALATRGARAVACGPMFDSRGPEYRLRDRAGGVNVPSRHPTRGLAVALSSAGLAVAGELDELADSPVVVQGYPALVRRGTAVPVRASPVTRRVALAVLSSRELALVSGTATMEELAAALARGGAREAAYLDGGRAAHLATATRVLVPHGSERPAAWIVLGRR